MNWISGQQQQKEAFQFSVEQHKQHQQSVNVLFVYTGFIH